MAIWLLWGLVGAAAAEADQPVRLYLPLDGDVRPAVGGGAKGPRLAGNRKPQFQPGLRGQALLLGGAGSAGVHYEGPEYVDPNRGTVALWVQAVDWDSSQNKGCHFFNLPPHAFLYRYPAWPDTMSFYCKYPDHGWYQLYSGELTLKQGRWTHIAVTWVDAVLTLYADGQPVASHPLWKPMTAEQVQGLSFGYSGDNRLLVDEVYVFGYPLAATEIATLVDSSRDGSPPRLPAPARARVYAVHYPGVQQVDAYVDIVDRPTAARVVKAQVAARSEGGQAVPLGAIEPLRDGRGQARLPVPAAVPTGRVRLQADLLDASGQACLTVHSEPFEKRIYPWQEKEVGVSDDVIAPFTPLEVRQNAVFCWGREYRFGPDGWPQQIVTRQAEVLASPVRLAGRVDGQELALKVHRPMAIQSAKPGVVEFQAGAQAGPLGVDVHGRLEYDGTIIYTLKATPAQSARVDALRLEIPIKEAHARLFHACRDQIRQTNEAGFVPAGRGRVWGSSSRASHRVLGTFLPYVWVGDYDRGLCWMCDSDQGWSVPDDQDAVEFVREAGVLGWRIHFFRQPRTLEQAWQVRFALQAGPPRPEPEGWRLAWGRQKTRLNWYCNVKTCQGYGRPPDMDQFRQFAEKWRAEHGCGWGVNTSPNDFWLEPGLCPENRYFQLEWRPGFPSPLRNNFVAYTVDQLMAEGLVAGLYSDDVYPRATANFVTGTGYVRADGRIQPTYSMFALRDFYKRLAWVHQKHRGAYGLLVHMTDSMIMPAYCFWDGKHDNEWGRRIEGKSWVEAFPLDEIAARCMSRQYGMAASWHTEARGHGDDLGVLLLLHDIVGRVESMDDRTLRAKLDFGLAESDVEHVGYWAIGAATEPASPDVHVSAWVRRARGTALATIGNLNKKPWRGRLRLPLERLGLPADTVACDGEEHRPSLPLADGWLEIAVEPENYRIVLLGKAGVFQRDLPVPGSALPRPEPLIADLCDTFDGPGLRPVWRVAATAAAPAAIEVYRGRLCVRATSYKFGCAERDFGQDNVTVQVRVERRAPGMQNRVGLALVWADGTGVFAGPGAWSRREQFEYLVFIGGKAHKSRYGSPVGRPYPEGLCQPNWVRIRLTGEKIFFAGSADGRTWQEDWAVDRPKEMAGPARLLRLGDTPDGWVGPYATGPAYVYFDDLFVGR